MGEDARNKLLAQGYILVPLKTDTKKPKDMGWPDIYYTANDVEGFVNVGINHKLSGTMSIDIDHKVLGQKLLKHLGITKGDLPGRYSARDDGWKVICKRPPGLDVNLIRNLNLQIDGQTHHVLELRANGHDVLPGSIHPDTRGEYKFLNGGMPDELPELPPVLADLMINWLEEMPQVVMDCFGVDWRPQDKDKTGEELSGNRQATVERFNEQVTVEEVLDRNGYIDGGNGRFCYPDSESKVPGVVVYGDVITSHHESGDPLNDSRQHDAFDCMRILECGGDWDAALAVALKLTQVEVSDFAAADFAEYKQEVTKTKAMGFTRLSDLAMAEPQWLIPGILEERAVSIWFGDPASYKTFLVVDAAMHVATGKNYHGMGQAKQGSVVYLAGEGHSGFARRVNAWCNYHTIDIQDVEFYKSDRAGTFEKGETRKKMLAGVEAAFMQAVGLVARLFVVDTLARNLGGDENSSEDINAMFDLLNRLQELYPHITILIVAHPGHQNPNRPRGSAALLGNTDAYAKVEATRERVAQVQSFKMKDAEDFPTMFFQMDLEMLGVTSDGEQFGSLVPRLIDAAEAHEGVDEGSAPDLVEVEKQRMWVALDCFRQGHAPRRVVSAALTDRGLPQYNNNKYPDMLLEWVADELLEELEQKGRYQATEYGIRWLNNRAEILWS